MPATGMILPQVDPTTVAVPAAGTVSLVVNLAGLLTVVKPDGSINPIAPINQTSSQSVASAGVGNVNVGPGVGLLVVNAAITGLGSTIRTFSIINAGLGAPQAGWRLIIFFDLSVAVAGIRLQAFNGNTIGQNLFDFTTDGIQLSAFAEFYWDGTQWKAIESKVPAN